MSIDPGRGLVIVGGSSAIAIACADVWIGRGVRRVVLVGRHGSSVLRARDDLAARHAGVEVLVLVGDLTSASGVADVADRSRECVEPDRILIALGMMVDQADCEQDLEQLEATLTVNALSPALCAAAFANQLIELGGGVLVMLGSVAGDRGRRSNYAYGASKGLVERFSEGMQHRFAGSTVSVVLAKPGPTDTPMTRHLRASGRRLAPVHEVAGAIVAAAESRRHVVYAPGRWRWIMLLIRALPRAVMHRLAI